MTADGKHVPKYARVAAAVKAQIADGTLRPGQPAPSGAALSRVTGYSTLTCRRALRVLIADGVLLPGPSRNARPRVAGAPQGPGERDLATAARALSAGLATRRRALGLTQPGLAALLAVSVTTIGHAETGRLWQSRQFWDHADAALGAHGGLLRLHDAFGEASASSAAAAPDAGEQAGAAETVDQATDPRADKAAAPEAAAREPAAPGAAPGPFEVAAGLSAAARATEAVALLAAGAPGVPSPAGREPACVMIMWGDGTVTTVHPPARPSPETPSGDASACAPCPD